ncbi:hypothetical protein ACOSP7_010299 [Xanthoceras sorbifolium]
MIKSLILPSIPISWKTCLINPQEDLKWRVGNGSNILFWTDDWVPNIGVLKPHALNHFEDHQLLDKVNCFLKNEDWDSSKLESVLPWNIIHIIASIHAGKKTSGPDRTIWSLTKNGEFSVKSAYAVKTDSANCPNWAWGNLWKLKLPPKIHFFLWLLLHGRILINVHRGNRGLTEDTTCTRCNYGEETINHLFRTCRYATLVKVTI